MSASRHPELPAPRRSRRRFLAAAIAVAVGLGAAASPFASPDPDGLERVATDEGFAAAAREPQRAPIPDYAAPGVDDERLATGLAGFAGTLGVFALASGAGVVLRRRGARHPAGVPAP